MNDVTQFFNTSGGGYQIERSLRFNSSDSAYLSRTPASAGNRKTWTWAGWVKRSAITSSSSYLYGLFSAESSGSDYAYIDFYQDGLRVTLRPPSGTQAVLQTTQVFRDPSAWYHIVVAQDTTQATAGNRIKCYVNGSQITSFSTSTYPDQDAQGAVNQAIAHNVGRDLANVLYSTNQGALDGYLADIHFIDGQALTPSSFTEVSATTGQLIPKAYSGSFGTNGFWLKFSDNSAATATTLGKDYSGNSNNWTPNNLSVRQVVQATYNSTYGSDITAGEAAKIFDGDLTTYGVATGNFVGFSYSGTAVAVKVENTAGTSKSFYIQPWVSGSPTNSGTFNTSGTNLWTVPASTTATAVFTFPAGYDGFARLYPDGTYADLRFYDIRTAQSEAAGNDSLVDTPTSGSQVDTGLGGQVTGNYATLNPIGTVKPATGVIPTLTNGNLDATHSGGSWQYANSTIAVPAGSGKYYCEFYISSSYAPDYIAVGVNPATASNFSATVHSSSQSGIFYSNNGEKWVTGSNSAYGSAYTTGDLIGVALNCDSGQITFYKNNTSQGAISFNSNLTNGGTIYFTIDIHTSNLVANFGQRQWAYAAPAGFKALCDTNLPAPVVAKPSEVMDVALWTGDGNDNRVITTNFSPEFLWLKRRDTSSAHRLADVVRGDGKILYSDFTDAETTETTTIKSLGSTGFTLGTSAGVNASGGSYVGWHWDAGSSTVTNTQGSITSQVRANPSAGFSIVTYTSSSIVSTVGHGLGVAPHLIITKNRSVSNTWWTYHSAIGNTKAMRLDTTAAETTISSTWNNTSPTSTVFTVGGEWGSGNSIVAYCFAPVAGYSSFGSWTGNGSTDGPFVYTGFRPRWVMWKPLSSGTDWVVRDAARDSYNIISNYLLANSSAAEGSIAEIDFLSNGFKFRNNLSGNNTNGVQVIYACFAEAPFQYARAR